MDRLAAELLYEHIKGIASELHEVPSEDIQAYVLIVVTRDGRCMLSSNIMREDQIRQVLAAQALDQRPMAPKVPGIIT